MAPRKDQLEGSCDTGWGWSLLMQRMVLVALGIDNLREAWLEFHSHPALSLLSGAMAIAIAVTLVLTWPRKRQ